MSKRNRIFDLTFIKSIWVKRAALALLDIACIFCAYLLTLGFRFGGIAEIEPRFMSAFLNSIWIVIAIHLVVNTALKLYSTLWRHAGISELMRVVVACALSAGLSYGYAVLVNDTLPRSIYLAADMVLILLLGMTRMSYRMLRYFAQRNEQGVFSHNNTLIIGAGDSGVALAKQLTSSSHADITPVGFIDDDPAKRHAIISGLRVLGDSGDIPHIVTKYSVSKIIFAVPSASPKARQRMLEICTATGCELKILPALESMLTGVRADRIRDVDIGDLLARAEVHLDTQEIHSFINGRTVLVTGGGGSIGSELCRQLARFSPRRIIIFDIYENNAYELYVDLKRDYPDVKVEVCIGSVRDMQRVDEVFSTYKPEVVFHAAAHKHVPLMETSPAEAVKNNVNGTFIVAKAADIAKVDRFVLISSDKAVNPTNIMGATKYLCELIMQYMNQRSANTKYLAVRFGNVLGSNGSVIPLFRKQIAAGGPVTVTHKDMTRYFMTIPEAAQLVLQTGAMAKQGEIFLLDMGEPVRIDDFARTFIRLSGFEPDVDIKIVYTGLRPGEKMYEELLQQSESVGESGFPGILVGNAHPLTAQEIKQRIDRLRIMVQQDPQNVHKYVAEAVPTYHQALTQAPLTLNEQQETAAKQSIPANGQAALGVEQ